jgi:hypothetical protein
MVQPAIPALLRLPFELHGEIAKYLIEEDQGSIVQVLLGCSFPQIRVGLVPFYLPAVSRQWAIITIAIQQRIPPRHMGLLLDAVSSVQVLCDRATWPPLDKEKVRDRWVKIGLFDDFSELPFPISVRLDGSTLSPVCVAAALGMYHFSWSFRSIGS